jgi:predicted RNA-binding Zn-ribbon protein involved in translation (DUF1610 family)
VLATKHAKLPLIAPPLACALGLDVDAVDVDTDTLGTFSGEIPRTGSALETAVRKARLGMKAAGRELGLANEGSIGPDPAMPLLTVDREIVVLVDDNAGIVIWDAYATYDIVAATTSARPGEDLRQFITDADFPAHLLIVRPNSGPVYPIRKGIDSRASLKSAIAEAAAVATDGRARIETDLRAHACPSRQLVIARAAERLAQRAAARCPGCAAPGWGPVDVLMGVPCSWCGTDVEQPRAEIYGCPACDRQEIRPLVPPEATGDPGICPACNP